MTREILHGCRELAELGLVAAIPIFKEYKVFIFGDVGNENK